MRRLSALTALSAAGVSLALVAAPVATADEGALTQRVFSIASADQPTVQRSAVAVVTSEGPTLDASNTVLAYSHDCTGCRAVAVGFQAVLVPGPTRTATPVNQVDAINYKCHSCTSFAFGDQYVVNTHGVRELSEQASERIGAIRDQAAQIVRSGATSQVMSDRLTALEASFHSAVDAGVAVPQSGDERANQQVSQQDNPAGGQPSQS